MFVALLFRSPAKEGHFYLTTHSTHFYLLLHGVGHMVKDNRDYQKGNTLPPLQGLLFSINSKRSFIGIIKQSSSHYPTTGVFLNNRSFIYSSYRLAHTRVFVTPVVEHRQERKIVQWVHNGGSIQRPIAPCVADLIRNNVSLQV